MYMFCKQSKIDNVEDGVPRRRKRGGDSGGKKRSNFLLERIFTVFDKRHEDVLSLREFTKGLHTLCRGSQEERVRLFFQMYDLDGGGSISRLELRRMFLQSPSYTGPENDAKAKKI